MLYADAVRGWDSTGVIGVERDGSFHISKEAIQATSFIDDYRLSKAYKAFEPDAVALIGHNRKKTMGKIEDKTAHPFVVDNTFAMVHNGTLYNHEQLAKTDVDSEALAIVLKEAFDQPKDKRKEAIEEVLGKVYGAYAVSIYNQKTNEVYLLRNKERPLSIVEVPGAWFWASEAPLAHWCMWRNGFEAKTMITTHCTEHVLYTIDLDKNKMTEEVLVPKKFYTPVTQHVVTGAVTSNTTATKSSREMLESTFPYFKQHHMGKVIRFYIDDYVEEDYPNTLDKGSTKLHVFGNNDNWMFYHTVVGVLDVSGMNLTDEKIKDTPFHATIVELEHSTESGGVTITVDDIKMMPESQVFGAEKLKARLDYEVQIESWTDAEIRLKLADKACLANWQVKMLTTELNSRKKHENSVALH